MKTKNPITYNMNVEDGKNIMILKYDQDPARVGNEMVIAVGSKRKSGITLTDIMNEIKDIKKDISEIKTDVNILKIKVSNIETRIDNLVIKNNLVE